MNYSGDTLEDITANEVLTELLKEDNLLSMRDEFLALDYFKAGWEAAMKFVMESKDEN